MYEHSGITRLASPLTTPPASVAELDPGTAALVRRHGAAAVVSAATAALAAIAERDQLDAFEVAVFPGLERTEPTPLELPSTTRAAATASDDAAWAAWERDTFGV